jgi:type III secretion system FlhB-like substrate exporter
MKELFEQLEQIIQNAYTNGVTIVEAETLAAQFLHAQLKVTA